MADTLLLHASHIEARPGSAATAEKKPAPESTPEVTSVIETALAPEAEQNDG